MIKLLQKLMLLLEKKKLRELVIIERAAFEIERTNLEKSEEKLREELRTLKETEKPTAEDKIRFEEVSHKINAISNNRKLIAEMTKNVNRLDLQISVIKRNFFKNLW